MNMDVEIRVDGEVAIRMEIGAPFLRLFQAGPLPAAVARSTPMTMGQVTELLFRVDTKSGQLLRQLAANGGIIGWPDVQAIFDGIDKASFASGFGKGITRTTRHILGKRSARLIWSDDDWNEDDEAGSLHVDGPALQALQRATGVLKDSNVDTGTETSSVSSAAPLSTSRVFTVGPEGPEKLWSILNGCSKKHPVLVPTAGGEPVRIKGVPSKIAPEKIARGLDFLAQDESSDFHPQEDDRILNIWGQGTLVRRNGRWIREFVEAGAK
jgi:hypothetical protein